MGRRRRRWGKPSRSRHNKEFLNHTHAIWPICQWCLRPLDRGEATADHLIPSSKGGSNGWHNLLVSCSPCNNNKRNIVLMNRRGIWADDSIRPHGPRWCGPQRGKQSQIINGSWCECHAVVVPASPVINQVTIADGRPDEKQQYQRPGFQGQEGYEGSATVEE